MTKVHTINTDVLRLQAPDRLSQLEGWLVWRYEAEGEGKKPRKMPYYADGSRRFGKQGGPEDRKRLTTFKEATQAAAKGGYNGVGLALLPGFDVIAVDFDDCMNEDGNVKTDVLEMVGATYCETSPSGTGIHAFFDGKLSDRKSHANESQYGFEIFSEKGFVTFTGDVLDICNLVGAENTVAPLNESVKAVYKQRFGKAQSIKSVEVAAPLGLSLGDIEKALAALDPGMGHDDWLGYGMAIAHETDGSLEGFNIWDQWSSQSDKYPGTDVLARRWDSFNTEYQGRRITGRTLMKAALEAGVRLEDSTVKPTDFAVIVHPPGTKFIPSLEISKTTKEPIANLRNTIAMLEATDYLEVKLAFDDFRGEEMICFPGDKAWHPIQDTDHIKLRMLLHRHGVKNVNREIMRDAIINVADRFKFDSAQDWLAGLHWDGVSRIDRFMQDYMGTEDTPYASSIGAYLWTALAGRVLEPGVKADIVPILVGQQGCGKSTAVAAMVPGPSFYMEVSLSEKEADMARKMRGRLIGEIAELRGLGSREIEHVKAFVTRTHENWVPKYRECQITFARRLVFIGTSNEDSFLDDVTGNRRWAPINVNNIQVASIVADRDQLWAEAAVRYLTDGVTFREAELLASEVHEKFTNSHPWEEEVEKWLEQPIEFDSDKKNSDRAGITTHDVLTIALRLDAKQLTQLNEKQAAKVLKRLGYVRKKMRFGSRVRWAYVKPTENY